MTNHKILLKDCEIFKEVDLKKNKKINFNILAYRSAKKIWWLCKNGHSFEATCHHRSRGSKCPGCSKYSRLITYEKSLAFLKPKLAKMWHPTKNGELTPEKVSASSTEAKYWFVCENKHEFQSSTNNKKNGKKLCSYCSKRLPSKEYNLEKEFSHLMSQWDFKKNKKEPREFTPGSNYKIWWKCKKGHSYKQSIKQKTGQNQGCNICNANISKPQIRIFTELKSIFKNVEFNKRIKKIEVDIFIPDLKIGIEYDGGFYHSGKEHKDLLKNQNLSELGIVLIRVREKKLYGLGKNYILLKSNRLKKNDLNDIIQKICELSQLNKEKYEIKNYLDSKKFLNDEEFNKYILNLPFPLYDKSLEYLYPTLCREWDLKKNKNLTPKQFLPSNHTKVWWLCKKFKHSWKASISDRTYKKAGCRICSDENKKLRFIEINKKRSELKRL